MPPIHELLDAARGTVRRDATEACRGEHLGIQYCGIAHLGIILCNVRISV